jgi:hypothetical protein
MLFSGYKYVCYRQLLLSTRRGVRLGNLLALIAIADCVPVGKNNIALFLFI